MFEPVVEAAIDAAVLCNGGENSTENAFDTIADLLQTYTQVCNALDDSEAATEGFRAWLLNLTLNDSSYAMEAIRHIGMLSYWFRVWTLQEAVLNKNTTLHFCARSHSADALWSLVGTYSEQRSLLWGSKAPSTCLRMSK